MDQARDAVALVVETLARGLGRDPAEVAVAEVTTYAKREFPTERIYAGTGAATLRIITCGGAYDAETGRYRSNTVVFADLVKDPARVPAPPPEQ